MFRQASEERVESAMSVASRPRPAEWSPSQHSMHDTPTASNAVVEMPSLSPQPSVSPSFADNDGTYTTSPREQQLEQFAARPDQVPSSKIKKKFSELDIRAAVADLDLRKSRSKGVGIEDFWIQLEDPHRIFYLPGDVVRGHVHLILDKPVKTQFVMLKLTGLLSVSMVREKVEYSILEQECVLWGNRMQVVCDRTSSPEEEYDNPKKQKETWEVGTMDEGEHPFPFEFGLPAKSMPSSIDFGKGSITYTIRCIHQRPSSFFGMRGRAVAQKDIPILDLIDVCQVRIPEPIRTRQPDHPKKSKYSGNIESEVELHKAGYLKGEEIRLNIKIKHTKAIKNLKGAIITFYRMSRFDSPKGEPSTFRKDLAQTVSPILVNPTTREHSFSPKIRIPPDTFPTINNVQYISFRYYLEVILDLNAKTSVFQTFSTAEDYSDEVKSGPATFIDTMEILKKNKPFTVVSQFEIVVGTLDSAAKDLEAQLPREARFLHHYSGRPSNSRRLPIAQFPSAPILPRRRDSAASSTSSTPSFTRQPPPPFSRNSSTPGGITLAGGPPVRSQSTNSRSSISKATLAEREEALLPSAPPEIHIPHIDASAPPLNTDAESPIDPHLSTEPPRIEISHSHESLTALRIEIPPSVNQDEDYLASLQSRISAPEPTARRPSASSRIHRRPVSSEIEAVEASAPPLDDDNASVSSENRTSFASTLPLYTPRV